MCGICGILSRAPRPLGDCIRAMNDAQAHRGPDGEGFCVAQDGMRFLARDAAALRAPTRCALGHRRLAIIDPVGGAQPMVSADGNVAVLLNGEIYNFLEIRARLEAGGARFKTNSDTEVLLHLYREEPDNPAGWLRELNGIFAIAIWDQQRGELLLARDAFGVKPLHYHENGGRFLFSSEIKGLLAAGIERRLNPGALHLFMNVRYVPGNETLFAGVRRLPPGHVATIRDGELRQCVSYYRLPAPGESAHSYSQPETRERMRATFYEAVRRQLLSDVPVGIPLSGGLDSSMVVAAAHSAYGAGSVARTADNVLRTFALGFGEPTDENEDARIVAEHFGADHHDTKLSADPLGGMTAAIRAVEEPKINIIQGYNLAAFVRQHVKVALGGLGGDELFAGYDIHRYCNTLGRLNGLVPVGIQRALLRPFSSLMWRIQSAGPMRKHDLWRIGAQIALAAGDRAQFYARLRNAWDYDSGMYDRIYARPALFRELPGTAACFRPWFEGDAPFLDQVLHAEFHTKMVNDFLLNEDRVTSAHGLEGRVPFLDRDLVELAFTIPGHAKMRGTETKWFWKQCVGSDLPPHTLRKKKHGFTFSSYHQWQKDLRATVARELTQEWCADTGLFNFAFIDEILRYPAHPNLRWHYFMVWMMLGVKEWMRVFDVSDV